MRELFVAAVTAASVAVSASAFAAAGDYRFELAAQPQKIGGGKSVVSVRLVHLPDNKSVAGAIIIDSRADMSPIGMVSMTGSVQALPASAPGLFRFEIANGSVWKKTDNWALSLAAKVQGESETVRGTITVRLAP